jgi:hypothetical protein
MKIPSQTDLNFYKTERQSNNKAYKLKSLYENTENIILSNLTQKSLKEDNSINKLSNFSLNM